MHVMRCLTLCILTCPIFVFPDVIYGLTLSCTFYMKSRCLSTYTAALFPCSRSDCQLKIPTVGWSASR